MKHLWTLLLIILILPSFFSLIRPGFFVMQDDLQAFRIHQMNRCFVDFQIPCRWIPDMGYQYGYPQFNFYPPGVFYLGEIFHKIGFQIIDSVKILFILGFIASAFGMFLFLKTFFGEWPALVGSILYTYAPFRAVEVYVRGSLSEFWALSFFPLIFWVSYGAIKSEKLKYFLWLAIFLGLLILTHHLMTFIFLPILFFWMITWVLIEKKWRILPKLLLSFLIAFGLSTFFTLPLIFEKQFVHTETLLSGYFDYRQHFVSVGQLFLSNYWDYGSSLFGSGDTVNLSTGPIHWIGGLLVFLLAILNFKKTKKLSTIIFLLAGLELLVLFLIHQRSSFIWEKINILSWLQFPWRFLAVSIFLLSILSAAAIFFLSQYKKGLGLALGIIAILGVFVLHANFFKPQEWLGISDKDKFSGPFWEKELTISIFDYLPIYAKLPPNKKAPDFPEILNGEAEFINYKKSSDYQIGDIKVDREAMVRVPLFDFPGMEVLIDQRKVAHWHDDCRGEEYCLGLITFNLPVGSHKIEIKLQDTPIRKTGNIITLVSICLLAALIYKAKKNEKNLA